MTTARPAWLVAAIDQRVTLMVNAVGGTLPPEKDVIFTHLNEPPEGEAATKADFARWDRTCDNCGRFCEPQDPFYVGTATETVQNATVVISYGVCRDCKEKT